MNTLDPSEIKDTLANDAPRSRFQQPVVIIVAAVALLLAVQWYDSHQQLKTLQAELARRLAVTDVENRSAAEPVRDAPARPEPAEAKQHESQNPQAALDTLSQDLARSRDDLLLADIEQTLIAANQQIQLAGNVRAALVSLQSIDARLARIDRPQFAALRKAVASDLERLKLAPRVEVAAMAAKLDELAAAIDALPLLIEARPSEVVRKPQASAEANPWLRFLREFWQDVRDLVRIEKIDNADTVPLSISQAYFLRENLRLRLLSARLALLAHNDKSYKSDLKTAREWLARYFDIRKESVANAVAAVRQLHDGAAGMELPDVSSSLDAVRGLRATRERR